jgi:hypothetical protein
MLVSKNFRSRRRSATVINPLREPIQEIRAAEKPYPRKAFAFAPAGGDFQSDWPGAMARALKYARMLHLNEATKNCLTLASPAHAKIGTQVIDLKRCRSGRQALRLIAVDTNPDRPS